MPASRSSGQRKQWRAGAAGRGSGALGSLLVNSSGSRELEVDISSRPGERRERQSGDYKLLVTSASTGKGSSSPVQGGDGRSKSGWLPGVTGVREDAQRNVYSLRPKISVLTLY